MQTAQLGLVAHFLVHNNLPEGDAVRGTPGVILAILDNPEVQAMAIRVMVMMPEHAIEELAADLLAHWMEGEDACEGVTATIATLREKLADPEIEAKFRAGAAKVTELSDECVDEIKGRVREHNDPAGNDVVKLSLGASKKGEV